MRITFLFYDGMTALDAVGPHEILCRLPGIAVKRAAKSAGKIITDSGLILNADYALTDVSHSDILFVPGAGNATTQQKYPEILNWVRLIHSKTTWTTSVCTGSLILGAAGILSGVKATTHWAALNRLSRLCKVIQHCKCCLLRELSYFWMQEFLIGDWKSYQLSS